MPSASLLVLGVCLITYVVAFSGVLVWAHRWRRHHRPPSGMAAQMGARASQPPVLLVTDSAVLLTSAEGPSWRLRQVRPGAVRALRGLVGIEADRDLLVVSFADGSSAALRQRAPRRGTAAEVAAEVAALAATALRRPRGAEPAQPSGRPGSAATRPQLPHRIG